MVAPVTGDRILPTGQTLKVAGQEITFPGRPNDVCYDAQRDLAFVKNYKSLLVVSVADWKLLQTIPSPGGASLTGIDVDRLGQVYFSNTTNLVHVFVPNGDMEGEKSSSHPIYALDHSIELPADSFPCGLCLSADQSQLFVCLSKSNSIATIDLTTNTVSNTIAVGISPFDVQLIPGGINRLFVSNVGGRRSLPGDLTAPSAGTETPVDERGIANTSAVSIIDLESPNVIAEIETGLHATALASFDLADSNGAKHTHILVTNSNDDSITTIDANSLKTKNFIAKPLLDLPFGSMPNSACVSPDGSMLFVGLAGNNAVAVYSLDRDPRGKNDGAGRSLEQPIGYLPTAWYPSGMACTAEALLIANLKGLGSRALVRSVEKGRNSHDHLGLLQKVSMADINDPAKLSAWTEAVIASSRVLPIVRDQLEKSTTNQTADNVQAQPVPSRLGNPSVFKHIIYVIKENRTYDQVFGDMPEGRGEPSLCIFPEKSTPNHHALARRFGLLDNYYCNGVLSADGHSWATEGNVTPYLERAFGGFSRSYTFGDDPITYSSSGFLWDHVLAAGLSFRNYGEMDYAKPPAGMKYQEIWNAFENGDKVEFTQNIGIEKLRRYSCRDYPGWNMVIPDVLRIDRFLKEFEAFKADGLLPNLCIVYLPQDHLGGGVTSAAHMADNDLAMGRLVEAVSQSDYWKDTLIIANEDDPQNGYDHIDGHRSICLVASAYSRPGVNHHFYNQTSVIRTMLHILGLPPMSQQDARSPLMTDCFVNKPNMAPYEAVEANYPLNQTPDEASQQSALERLWRSRLATVPIERTGMKTMQDEDTLNRFVWHETQGWTTPYPSEYAGAHGRGLKALQLALDPSAEQE